MNIFSFPELKTKFSQIPQALNFCQPRGYKKIFGQFDEIWFSISETEINIIILN